MLFCRSFHGASVICINYRCINLIYCTSDGAGKYKCELLLLLLLLLMILGISWRDKVSNKKVMKRVQTELQTELHFTKDMIKRKMEYAGHVLRVLSGLSHLQILEGKLEGKKEGGSSSNNMDG